jgi:DNA-binding Xre family transcriptional regulator
MRIRLKVKELAEARGYNMSKLSRASDVSFNTIKRYFKKPYETATTYTLMRIAKVLCVEIGDLIEIEKEPEQ